MSKKILTAVLCLCLAALQLTSCGNDISNTGDVSRAEQTTTSAEPSSLDDPSGSDSSAAEASVKEYAVSVSVGEEYTAQKLGELAVGGSGMTYTFDDGSQTKKFDTIESSVINLTAENSDGFKSHIVIKVISADHTAPVFTGVKDIVVEQGDPVDLKSGVSAKDDIDGEVSFTVAYDDTDLDTSSVGKHNLTYTAKDSAGNIATANATIEVKAKQTRQTQQTQKQTQQTQKQTQQTQKQTQQSVTPKPPAGSSANVSFYQNLIHVAGDSIAYGFCSYGYIPLEHNIAQGSLAMRNYTSYGWFNVNGRQMRCMDAVATLKPRLLYVSMGMNDINITNAQTYANNYVGFLKQVRAKVPNCIIVAANITPTGIKRQTVSELGPSFTVTKIQNCNAAMTKAVKAMNDPNIILFDAYSVVSAGGTYMASGYGAGDQLHLASHVYQKLLNSLAIVLDQYSVRQRLS
ncbi:MAG: DUF5011 domain-containing protein [Ruminococcus sp.]|nr:DUF5011 domain-containing protein [Ruminococcus sp.]